MTAYCDIAFARHLFERLRVHWREEEGYTGVYRPGYSREENVAIAILVADSSRIGMECYADMAGNVYMIMPGKNRNAKTIVIGSHIDSVPQGGRYDGVAGVVAGLAICSAFKNANIMPEQDVCIMILRAEESPWYGACSIGSSLAVGSFPTEKLETLTHAEDGRTLAEHMNSYGVNPWRLKDASALFPIEQTAAFVELHIEQGPVLQEANIPVGIVSSNRGNIRVPYITMRGEKGHTGALPMAVRKDAVRAAARFITRFEDEMQLLVDQGKDVVFTVPVLSTAEDASPTTIPDECSFYLEARSDDEEVLSQIDSLIDALYTEVAARYHVSIEKADTALIKPVMMDDSIQKLLVEQASEHAISYQVMASGARHDAAEFAQAGVPSGMVFVRHDGRSHRSDEELDIEDLAVASNVLAHLCMKGIEVDMAAVPTFKDVLIEREAEPIMTQDDEPATVQR